MNSRYLPSFHPYTQLVLNHPSRRTNPTNNHRDSGNANALVKSQLELRGEQPEKRKARARIRRMIEVAIQTMSTVF